MLKSQAPLTSGVIANLLAITVPAVSPPPVHWQAMESPSADLTLWQGAMEIDESQGPVACLLYKPRTPGPWPAAVAIHQHNNEYKLGKSELAGLAGDRNAAYGLKLAQRGFIVAMPDLTCFETRRPRGDDDARNELLTAMTSLVRGGSLHSRYVMDVLSVARYLEAHEHVDGAVSVIGHSLGGQIALLALAVDEKIRRGVISCGLTTYDACERARVLHNPGWYIPRLQHAGGYAAIARGVSEKKVLAVAATRDEYFPADGTREVLAAFPDGVVEAHWREGTHAMTAVSLDLMTRWLAREHN